MLGLFFKKITEYGVFPFAVEDYLTYENADPNTYCAAVQMEDNTDDFELDSFFSMASAAQAKLVILGYELLSDEIHGFYFDSLIAKGMKYGYVEIPGVYEDRIVFRQDV